MIDVCHAHEVKRIQPTLRFCPVRRLLRGNIAEEHGRMHVVGVHNVVEAFLLGVGFLFSGSFQGAQLGLRQDSVVVVDTTTGTALAIVAG